ncbi:MAG: acylneuraminate cytidylyltransferase family protein [Phycisphaerales bacterium]
MKPTVAIILARAGSKGLPGKNSAPVADRPCVAWTIDDALAASSIDRVVVSTDCPEVAKVAGSMGVEVVNRPPALANDSATVDDAARDCAVRLFGSERKALDSVGAFVILYANVPVRPAGLLDRAVGLLTSTGCDSVQSYAPVGKHHPWWTAIVSGEGVVRPWEGDVLNHGVHRRQDLPPAHIPDGGVIAVTPAALFLRLDGAAPGPHAFFGIERRGVLTNEGDVIDIDSRIDLLVADAVLRDRVGAPRRTA